MLVYGASFLMCSMIVGAGTQMLSNLIQVLNSHRTDHVHCISTSWYDKPYNSHQVWTILLYEVVRKQFRELTGGSMEGGPGLKCTNIESINCS